MSGAGALTGAARALTGALDVWVNFSAGVAFDWTARLLALAVGLQALEILQLKSEWLIEGPWSWAVVRRDFEFLPAPLRALADAFYSKMGFLILLFLQIILAVGLAAYPHSFAVFGITLTLFLISLRWRGTFNGGSDRMVFLIALALSGVGIFGSTPKAVLVGLVYIAVQSTLSYFVPGVLKLLSPRWRSGQAFELFLRSSLYEVPAVYRDLIGRRGLLVFISWALIDFECLAPTAWIGPSFCLAFLALALLFHLLNFYIFGLNRFFFAWAATYPALYFCSKNILHLGS